MRYILALGSNMGDKEKSLRKTAEFLSTLGTVTGESSVYETTAVGMEPGTENFYNCVIVLESEITPEILIGHIKKIERKMGRSLVNSHMKPRVIDIDILFADRIVLNTPSLTIPHPRLENRKFVLVPLAEILPGHIHPVSGKTVKELLDKLETGEKVRVVTSENNLY